eukprot:jgi/Botrbrau1/1399/Bobra.0063s0099.2
MGPSKQHAGRPGEPIVDVVPPNGPNGPLNIPKRILMGPGPSNAYPRVLAAQSLPLLGHMHPPFFQLMDEIQEGLRYLFQTQSPYTLLISGTGHAGMEAVIANLVEPGEKVLIGNSGIWGQRAAELASRFQAEVINLEVGAGGSVPFEDLRSSVETLKPAVVFLVQGESSTGVHQSLAGVGQLCRDNGALLVVDTVASLGGVPFFGDEWLVDAAYSGTQKVLSAPPGGAPLFFGERAFEKLRKRKSPPATYNLDLNLIGDYWGWFKKRFYHHTGMVSNWYGVREALAIVGERGLPALWKRHQEMHDRLWAGLKSLGLEPYVEQPDDRLVTVNTIKVPTGVDWAKLTAFAMSEYHLEIAGGLGPSAGHVWRIGIMGYNAEPENVDLVLLAFKEGLAQQGFSPA